MSRETCPTEAISAAPTVTSGLEAAALRLAPLGRGQVGSPVGQRTDEARRRTLERELEWVRMAPRARHAKGKARLKSYEELLTEDRSAEKREAALEIAIPPGPRLGDVVIEAKDLTKGYGDKLLIDDLSFSLPRAGIVGIVGPNGAGKSTTMRMIAGFVAPTGGTASQLGVGNRLKPAQSIRAGARYLVQLRKRLPDDIHEPLRTWLALAAYNLGLGHVLDALKLETQLHRKDPASWRGISKVLPLLAKHRYYRHLAHGYARGNEAVRYVNRIRYYQDILRQQVQGAG